MRRKAEADRKMFAETHEMAPLAAPRSSARVDPTASIQNLSNVRAEEIPVKT